MAAWLHRTYFRGELVSWRRFPAILLKVQAPDEPWRVDQGWSTDLYRRRRFNRDGSNAPNEVDLAALLHQLSDAGRSTVKCETKKSMGCWFQRLGMGMSQEEPAEKHLSHWSWSLWHLGGRSIPGSFIDELHRVPRRNESPRHVGLAVLTAWHEILACCRQGIMGSRCNLDKLKRDSYCIFYSWLSGGLMLCFWWGSSVFKNKYIFTFHLNTLAVSPQACCLLASWHDP